MNRLKLLCWSCEKPHLFETLPEENSIPCEYCDGWVITPSGKIQGIWKEEGFEE